MKKAVLFLMFIGVVNLSGQPGSDERFFMCAEEGSDCATFIIEDDEGFSWYIECGDDHDDGRTDGAKYAGLCPPVQ